MNKKGKYSNHYFCYKDKWILKALCIEVELKSGLFQTRCPYCNHPIRKNPRTSELKEKYLNEQRY
jgi:uncharacterized protein with PIN domain